MNRTLEALVLLLLLLARPARAQDLEYTTTTSLKAAGGLGPLSQMMGGAQSLSARAFLKGTRLRLDIGSASTLVDGTKQQVTMLDHNRRTFMTTSFAAARRTAGDSAPNPPGTTVSASRSRAPVRVNGVLAHHTSIVVRVPARNPKAARATDIIVITEVWTSNAGGIGDAYDRAASVAEEFGGGAAMMVALLSQNPRAGAALQQAAQAASEVPGLPVRRRTVYGNARTGSKVDVAMTLDTLMALTTDITNVRRTTLPVSLFEVPAGYSSPAR